ncbi:MAG: pentapeptide repeat-containing protein [Nocardia sp.]|nr:pentapeptide repeat-containing protein [Nocardia sp.]
MRRWLGWGGIGAGLTGLFWLYFKVPIWLLHDPKDADAFRGQLTTLLGFVIASATALFGITKYYLDREKQRTDIFNAAIANLGSPDPVIRAGGVRALARMMAYSAQDRDRVRATFADILRHRTTSAERLEPGQEQPSDISAILTALQEAPHLPEDRALNLRSVRLPGAPWPDVELPGALLARVDFAGATLRGIMLVGADLDQAVLTNADLAGADLHGARLTRSRMVGAILTGSRVDGADFTGAALNGADLRGVDLRATIGLTSAQIDSAKTDSDTQLPEPRN